MTLRKLYLNLFFMITITFVHGQESIIHQALRNQKLTQADQEKLINLIFGKKENIQKAIAEINDKALAARINEVKKFINSPPHEDNGKNALGATVAWHLTYKGGVDLIAYPVLAKVVEGGIAEKSGLFMGDIIFNLAGVHIAHIESRNRFMLFLKIWPPITPIEFNILSANKNSKLSTPNPKNHWKKIIITLPQQERQ